MAINTQYMLVDESSKYPGQFYWSVYNKERRLLTSGYTYTKDQAIRNARSYIRNNKNAVYG